MRSEKFLADIGLKTQVTLDDALSILSLWRKPESHFKARYSFSATVLDLLRSIIVKTLLFPGQIRNEFFIFLSAQLFSAFRMTRFFLSVLSFSF